MTVPFKIDPAILRVFNPEDCQNLFSDLRRITQYAMPEHRLPVIFQKFKKIRTMIYLVSSTSFSYFFISAIQLSPTETF